MTRTVDDSSAAQLAQVVAALTEDLGPESSWPSPIRLESLAECVMNSIYSTGNRSESVIRVLDRYRDIRRAAGANPTLDGPKQLIEVIEERGGPEGFADALGNQWRAWSSVTAPLKTEAIYGAAKLLVASSVETRDQLEAALKDPDSRDRLKGAWRELPGQRRGLTWRYFLMNAGMPGIKADRMLTRWTERVLGRSRMTPGQVEVLLTDAAAAMGVDTRNLDHALWDHERRAQ